MVSFSLVGSCVMNDDMQLCDGNVISISADNFYRSVAHRVVFMKRARDLNDGKVYERIKSELDLLLLLIRDSASVAVSNSDSKIVGISHCPNFYAEYGILLPSWLAIKIQSNRYWPDDDMDVDE